MLSDIWVYKKTSRIMIALLLVAVVMLSTQNWQLGLLLFIIVAGFPGIWTICPPACRRGRCMR